MATMTELLKEMIQSGKKENAVYQNVSSVGDGTGVINLIGAAPAAYTVTPASGTIYRLKRMTLLQIDGSFNPATGYGAGNALTNGITITVENGSGIIKNYTPEPIKTTHEWGLLAGVDSVIVGGAGADANLVRWTFAAGSGNIDLDGSSGEFLKIDFGDIMSFMDMIRIQVQGYTL